ncbi:MAG TPA: hypothetical protein VFM10_10790 [Terriglobales bacterium]|jgi:hypothetical protein|nr:hypothetical protein [Terriglobales bacterium]
MAVIEVRINYTNGQFVPSQDPITLSKSKGETIKWYNETAERLTLEFANGTPFPPSRNPYTVDPDKQVDSGNIQVQEGTEFSYTIKAASGAMVDPQVIIER